MPKRDPYPLAWPDGWKRTLPNRRQQSKFKMGLVKARDEILRELKLMRGSHVSITSNLPVRNDGLPYAAGRVSNNDPGVAVWWVQNGVERVIACDCWDDVVDNLRGIGATIAALRGIERWGASEIVTRAFAGFAALPPGSSETSGPAQQRERPWRDVLGGAWPEVGDEFPPDALLALVKTRAKRLLIDCHPDKPGGSLDRTLEINAAVGQAEKELG